MEDQSGAISAKRSPPVSQWEDLEPAMIRSVNHSLRSTLPSSRSLSMSENHEPPITEFLHAVKNRRCPLCGGQARLLIDIDTNFPQLDLQGRTQYFCLRCERVIPGRIVQRTIK